MKRFAAFLALLGASLAQTGTQEPLYCGVPASSVPVVQRHPALWGSVSPQVLTAEGSMTFAVTFQPGAGVVWDYLSSPWIEVEWRFNQRFNLPGTPPGSSVAYNWKTSTYTSRSTTYTTYTMTLPITLEAQGTYRLRAQGAYCYKGCPTCAPQNAYLNVDIMAAAFIPQPSASLSRLLWLLDEESKRNGAGLEIYVVSTDLAPSLKSLLSLVAQGGFYDCNIFGICAKRSPAKVQRVLTDKPNALRNLVATGCLVGGIIPGCQGNQDSRVYDIGPTLQPFGVLIASGINRDYIAFGTGLVSEGLPIYLFEGPKGAGGMLKEALLFAFMQKQGREVR